MSRRIRIREIEFTLPRRRWKVLRPLWGLCGFCFGMGALHALGNADAGAALIAIGLASFCFWRAAAG